MIGTLLKGTLLVGKKAIALGIQYYVVSTVTQDLNVRIKRTVAEIKKQKELKSNQQ